MTTNKLKIEVKILKGELITLKQKNKETIEELCLKLSSEVFYAKSELEKDRSVAILPSTCSSAPSFLLLHSQASP